MLRYLPVVIAVVLAVAALVDLSLTAGRPRTLSRPVWVLLILLVPVAGPSVWFYAGRPLAAAQPPTPLEPPRPRQHYVAPDDDPAFLDKLKRDIERRRREGGEPRP